MADPNATTCGSCGQPFQAKTSRARFCCATCRSRAARDRKAAEHNEAEKAKTGTDAEHDLVKAVRLRLEKANATLTVAGQLALQMARRLAAPDASGVSSLSKELRALLEEAEAETGTAPSPTPAAPAEADDEVQAARRRREEMAEQARRAAE